MEVYITIAQVIVSIILIISILMQKQGTGLGGSGENYYSRRGTEKILFFATIILIILFLGLGVANIIV